MLNHVHGIVVIDKIDDDGAAVESPNLGVSTTPDATNITTASEKWKPGTLGVIINQYKHAVTINTRKICADFVWQSRFHDPIIRNKESFERICNYMLSNSENWEKDKFNK